MLPSALTRLVEHHWILIALSVIGGLMILIAPLAPLREARRLRERMDTLSHAQLLVDIQEIAQQSERISKQKEAIEQLVNRSRGAYDSMRTSAQVLRVPEATMAFRIALVTVRILAGLHR
jgi:hypothetical protein